MKVKITQQMDFSTILFDSLFGLILFFSIDSFLDISNPLHFVFYLFSIIVVIHWWLIYKSVDDAFDTEVTDSGLDLIIGIIELILIEYIVLMSRSFDFIKTAYFLIILLIVDLVWTIIWRYIGKWRTTDKNKIRIMEKELDNNWIVTTIATVMFIFLIFLAQFISSWIFILLFIIFYLIFIFLTFKYKIIDIDFF